MSSSQVHSTESQRYKDFLQLIVEHKNRILGFILTLVPNRTIAEDLLQESILVMWEKFAQFEMGTNFWAWSCKIAYYKVMKYRSQSRNSPVLFSEDVICSLAERYEQMHCESRPDNDKIEALESCLKKLSKRDSRLVQLRYLEKQTIAAMARTFGWSCSMTYKLMAKIHYSLKECIEKKLSFVSNNE